MKNSDEALERLHEWLKPGDTLHTILRHRSASGMTRWITVIKLSPAKDSDYPMGGNNGVQILDLDYNVSPVLGRPLSERWYGVKCEGAGMDMGFELVYNLSRRLFPDGYGCIGKGCPANDHVNGDRNYEPHSEEAPHWHRDGGYALKQSWL